jgi:hypothetical protein
MRPDTRACVILLSLLPLAGEAQARVYLPQQEALDRAFPAPQRTERRTLYLDAAQARRTADLAGVPVEARVVPYYVGRRDGRVTGYAYFDSHLVRTLPETIMVLLDPQGRIVRIDILAFDEPEDYLPGGRWLQQFAGRDSGADLTIDRGIRGMTGATLSARAITRAARRILALHRLWVAPDGGADAAPAGGRP